MNDPVILTLGLGGGVALGLVYFWLVRVSADLLLSSRRGGLWQGLALSAGRLLGLGAVLTYVALQGTGLLLVVALGWLIGRFAVMRRAT